MKLTTWLKDRELNCRRLASGKTGSDRDGWIEDAEHFQAALAEIERLADALKRANNQAEHFEREWYLRGDEIEAAMPTMREYARKNQKHHFSTDGTEQDPNGAHAWIERNDKPNTGDNRAGTGLVHE